MVQTPTAARSGTPEKKGGLPLDPATGAVTLEFYRQRGVKVDWRPGDRCRRLKDGQRFTVVRLVADVYPPYVMLAVPGGEERAELPLIAPVDEEALDIDAPPVFNPGGIIVGGRALPLARRRDAPPPEVAAPVHLRPQPPSGSGMSPPFAG